MNKNLPKSKELSAQKKSKSYVVAVKSLNV